MSGANDLAGGGPLPLCASDPHPALRATLRASFARLDPTGGRDKKEPPRSTSNLKHPDARLLKFVIGSASEAIQRTTGRMDRFVAFAPRAHNEGARNSHTDFSFFTTTKHNRASAVPPRGARGPCQ